MTKQENRFILVKLVQDGSGMVVGAGVPIQNMFVNMDHQPGNSASGTLSGNILNSLVTNQQSGKQKQIAKSKHLMTWVDNKDFKHQRDIQNERNSMKPINQMTLKELKKAEMDLSEYLHFKDERNEKISQEERNELDAIRSRLNELDPPKY